MLGSANGADAAGAGVGNGAAVGTGVLCRAGEAGAAPDVARGVGMTTTGTADGVGAGVALSEGVDVGVGATRGGGASGTTGPCAVAEGVGAGGN